MTPEELKKVQQVELELLIEFDRICRKHAINYSLDGGTLIGAVRHKGFIPWDDDADVVMTRPEYEKFLAVVERELDHGRFYFHEIGRTPGYRWGYAKLRRRDSAFVRLGQEHMPYEQGIFLDIFVADQVPDNYLLRCLCNFHCYVIRKILYSKVGKYASSAFKRPIYWLLNLIPEKAIKRYYRFYVRFRNRKPTQTVKCITFPTSNRYYGYKRKWFEDTMDMAFEGAVLRGSRHYDEYLRFRFGDYMKLPPVEKRKTHAVSKVSFPPEMEQDFLTRGYETYG